ncbi:MAG: hypothetical protein SF052_07775 [Bacteroidia bacterium]|nr:hypothetical protein [Bacteroidia bacterium]
MKLRILPILVSFFVIFSFKSTAQDSLESHGILEIVLPRDTMVQRVIRDRYIYAERWDTLAQMRFWRRVMTLSPDSSVLNVADTRQILHTFPTAFYDSLSGDEKLAFKDSMLTQFSLAKGTRLYVTYGKSDYYQHRAVLPTIGKAIDIFNQYETDPWYGQAILLIESPGQIRKSSAGANGSFQLMKYVAVEGGLTVNSVVDEREDFEKSAMAAAKYLKRTCIPEVRGMLNAYGLPYDEKELWFRLLVLHVYHAGAGNVRGVMRIIQPQAGGMDLIRELWTTEYKGFRNASQNYSQVALASFLELDRIIETEYSILKGQ